MELLWLLLSVFPALLVVVTRIEVLRMEERSPGPTGIPDVVRPLPRRLTVGVTRGEDDERKEVCRVDS